MNDEKYTVRPEKTEFDLTNEQDVYDYLAKSKTMHDWNTRKQAVLDANGGEPSYFQTKFIDSGWFANLVNSWNTTVREDNGQ